MIYIPMSFLCLRSLLHFHLPPQQASYIMWPPKPSSSSSKKPEAAVSETTSKKKLRFACDRCHHAKTKCSGGAPCSSCASARQECNYSVTTQTGRPKGAKNKKRTLTVMKEKQQAEASSSQASSSHEKTSPSEMGEGGHRYPAQSPGPYHPPGAYNVEQRTTEVENTWLEDSFSDDMSSSVNWSSLGEYLDYNAEEQVSAVSLSSLTLSSKDHS